MKVHLLASHFPSFDLKNALADFLREMQKVLRDYDSKLYIDDIYILGRSFDVHLQHLRVLHTLQEYGIKVQSPKCERIEKEVPFNFETWCWA